MHAVSDKELMAWLDGELSDEKAVHTAGHVEHCTECQVLMAELRMVSDRLADWQVESLPPDMPGAISSALRTPTPLKSRTHPVAWSAAVFATACLVLVLFVQPRFQKPAMQSEALIERNEAVAQYGVMIVRTARLRLTTASFDNARAALNNIVQRHEGYFGEMSIAAPSAEARTLNGSVRIPADQLEATLAEVRRLGRVEWESQSSEDVSRQYVDLEARLSNKRNTEQRLIGLLRDRTGKLADVLAVEQQLDNVRGEIEQMEAERKSMQGRVDFTTLAITLAEAREQRRSFSGRIAGAAADGYRKAAGSVAAVVLFVMLWGPVLLLWAGLLFLPARAIWKRLRYVGRTN